LLGACLIKNRLGLGRPSLNPLNTELNPICHLLALLGAHHIFHVSGLRVNTEHNTEYYLFKALDVTRVF